jgi:hypothetical protein
MNEPEAVRYVERSQQFASDNYSGTCQEAWAAIMFPVQANAVFVRMPDAKMAALRDRGWRFYTFIQACIVTRDIA